MTGQWQTIESAPKDGTWVLLTGGKIRYGWNADDVPPCVVGQWTHHLNGSERPEGRWQFAWYDGGYYGEYEAPTHWMDLSILPAGPHLK